MAGYLKVVRFTIKIVEIGETVARGLLLVGSVDAFKVFVNMKM
jgi:hypothetical protein